MSPKTIVITGGSDGVGAAAARDLKGLGENVVIVGRSPEKTAAVGKELGAPFHVADYADLDQVRTLAADLAAAYPQIDVLANNAGGIMGHRTITRDGNELTFQVNHLAGFLLTHLLMPTLAASRATVIQTSSAASRRGGGFDLADLQNEKGYTPFKAYSIAKLENILFTSELQRRYAEQGISAVAFHPGVVASNFAAETTHLVRHIYRAPVITNLFMIPPKKGADQLVWLSQGTPGTDWELGAYYEKRKLSRSLPAAHSDDNARSLWDASARLLDLDQ